MNQIVEAVNDQFTKIFGVDDRKAIEAATVYSEPILDTGRQFKTRYWGRDKDLVVSRGQKAVDATDPYRSPSLSKPYQYRRDFWAVDFNYWGL